MEFAYVLKNYGVDVTIVEFLPRALPNEDAEVSKEIEKQYKKLGVKILTGTKVGGGACRTCRFFGGYSRSGGQAWCVRWVRPSPWIARSARHPGSSRK